MQYYFDPTEIPGIKFRNRFQNEFEYLFFLLEPDKSLATNREYSPEYVNYLKNKFNIELKITDYKNGNLNYWFLDNYQQWHFDKIKIFNFIKKLDLWDHELFVANKSEEIPSGNYLIKTPLGFSGQGVFDSNLKKKFSFPVLVEQKLHRIKDFSFFYHDKKMVYYENFIGNQYNYTGSLFNKNFLYNIRPWFEKEGIENKEILLFEKRIEKLKFYLFENSFQSFNVDCFLYRHENEVKVNAVCEINLRKTMGYLLYQLYQKYFFDQSCIHFTLSKDKPLKEANILGPRENENFYIYYDYSAFKNDWL